MEVQLFNSLSVLYQNFLRGFSVEGYKKHLCDITNHIRYSH